MTSLWDLHVKNRLNVLGLMSGTSLDGLDICLTAVERQNLKLSTKILQFDTFPYTQDFRDYLHSLFTGRAEQLCQANFVIAKKFAEFIDQFLIKYNLKNSDIDLIGSHGQTIWHIHGSSTLQLGEASVLAEKFFVPVISDFRVRDVAAGGSGAPLIPYVDYVLFRDLGRNVMVLNIGGIANFTIVPANAHSVDQIYALDAGPGNAMINIVAEMISEGELHYDRDGEFAKKGVIRKDILDDLMDHPYIAKPMPKSTGRETFGLAYIEELLKKWNLGEEDLFDLIATLTRFTAEAIYSNYNKFFKGRYNLDEIIMSGGGSLNPLIVKHISSLFPSVKMSHTDDYGINSNAKEAFGFAVLAAETVWNRCSNIPNVTGASHPVVLGKIIP